MQTTINIRIPDKKDFSAICQLLSEENLPTADINPTLENFFITVEGNELCGVMGMDRYGNTGLLRSAIVKKEYRRTGIAAALINQLVDYAKKQGVESLYLITNTAEKYFAKKGFEKITKNEVPETVLQSKEFNGLCPVSAVIMFRKL
jgi:amino-acid N-acetyltransferase